MISCTGIIEGFPGSTKVKNHPANAGAAGGVVRSLGWKDPLEEEMATHSSNLAGIIPKTEETGGLQSMGLQRVTRLNTNTTSPF